jgi:hypothetical protein
VLVTDFFVCTCNVDPLLFLLVVRFLLPLAHHLNSIILSSANPLQPAPPQCSFNFSCYLFNCMVRLYKNHTPAYLSLILILHNSVTIIMATNNSCFKVRWNHVYFVSCFTSGRNRVWFLWIEQQKVTGSKCHSQSNLRECKVTNDCDILADISDRRCTQVRVGKEGQAQKRATT